MERGCEVMGMNGEWATRGHKQARETKLPKGWITLALYESHLDNYAGLEYADLPSCMWGSGKLTMGVVSKCTIDDAEMGLGRIRLQDSIC